MNSCIYRGTIAHRRFSPVPHRVRLPLFMMYLDLSELDRVFEGRRLWSASRPALARFKREDHLGDPSTSLDQAVRDKVELETGKRPDGPIRLLTHLRYFGYTMNPISLFFCFDGRGRVEAVLAEVNNTPWGERHCYVLRQDSDGAPSDKLRATSTKEFHVSPFMGMDMTYHWTIATPGRGFAMHLENRDRADRVFDATLTMERREIGAAALNGLLLRYPFMTLQVLASIYLHAGLLWLKRVPFHAHPSKAGSAGGQT